MRAARWAVQRGVPALSVCVRVLAGRALLQAMGEHIPKLKSRADGKVCCEKWGMSCALPCLSCQPASSQVKGPNTPGIPLPGYPETLLPVAIAPNAVPPEAGGSGAMVAGSSGGGGSSKKKKGGK